MEARSAAPSGGRENWPFASQESPLARQEPPFGTIRQHEAFFPITPPLQYSNVPLPVPPFPALYGLFRAKKINKKSSRPFQPSTKIQRFAELGFPSPPRVSCPTRAVRFAHRGLTQAVPFVTMQPCNFVTRPLPLPVRKHLLLRQMSGRRGNIALPTLLCALCEGMWLNLPRAEASVPVCPGLSRFVPHLKNFLFFPAPVATLRSPAPKAFGVVVKSFPKIKNSRPNNSRLIAFNRLYSPLIT